MAQRSVVFGSLSPFVRFSRTLSVFSGSGLSGRIPLDRRIFFLLSGSARISAGKQKFEINPGELVYIPSGVFYSINVFSDEAVFYALNFDLAPSSYEGLVPIAPVSPEDFEGSLLSERVFVTDAPELDAPFRLGSAGALGDMLVRIDGEFSKGVVFSRSVAGAYLVSLLAECIRRVRFGVGERPHSLGDRVLDYLHENYRRPLTNAGVASVFFVHPNYLSAVVKKRTGMSLHRYVVFLRLNHAAKLLENGGMSVSRIASECGFCDVSHFSREFRKHFFVSPVNFVLKK